MKKLFSLISVILILATPLAAQSSPRGSVEARSLSSVEAPSLEAAFSPQTDPAALTGELASAQGEALILAALDFSLCPRTSSAYAAALSAYRALEKEAASRGVMSLAEEERAEAVLNLLYEKTLLRYSLKQSRMDVLLSEGTYNCVSSSAVYMALATACGISVTGNLTKDHAFCTVHVTDGAGGIKHIDVETTNPAGFNPGTRKPVETHGGGTAYFIVPKTYYANRASVSPAMLVSSIGKNLMAEADKANDYARAVPLGAARFPYALTPSEKASVRLDFDTVCANYALSLDHAGKSTAAVAWLDSVYERWGETAYLAEHYDTVAYNALADFMNASRYTEAESFLSAHASRMTAKLVKELSENLFLVQADSDVQKLAATDSDAALARLRELKADNRAQTAQAKKRFGELTEYCWFQKINALFGAKDYLAAAALADEALSEVPQSRNLQNLKKQALQNHAVGYHNRFAVLANAGQYEEALAVIEQGLKENPTNATLKADAQRIKKMLGR